jgi:hypothetical protein
MSSLQYELRQCHEASRDTHIPKRWNNLVTRVLVCCSVRDPKVSIAETKGSKNFNAVTTGSLETVCYSGIDWREDQSKQKR